MRGAGLSNLVGLLDYFVTTIVSQNMEKLAYLPILRLVELTGGRIMLYLNNDLLTTELIISYFEKHLSELSKSVPEDPKRPSHLKILKTN